MAVSSFPHVVKAASFVVERSQMRVTGDGFSASFPSAIGDFGIPNYGAILVGQVAFIPENAAGCSEFFTSLPAEKDILLVDRGSCYFVEKAYHAQMAGAKAVIVADNVSEDLLTMASPEDRPELAAIISKLAIPTVLVTKEAGDQIKEQLQRSTASVTVEIDWSESIAHGQKKVAWEYWFTTNDACGEHAGKYAGADVVEMNARHLCAFQVANTSAASSGTGTRQWWDFASRFATSCGMTMGTFTAECAHEQLQAAGIDVSAVEQCVGLRDSDAPLDILEAQLNAQMDVEDSGRGRVILLPTVVINYDQYRGSLTPGGVLRALCSGFLEGTEPSTCLTGGLEVDECAAGTHGCWTQGDTLTACVDTFRGFACRCPAGWEGDGHTCTDVDECSLGISGCDQICINTPGSYHCDCNAGYTLHGGQGAPGMCIPDAMAAGGGAGKGGHTRIPGWLSAILFFASVASVSVAGVAVYRWRMQRDMEGEIRAIMREYMPLPAGEDAAEAGRGGGGPSFFNRGGGENGTGRMNGRKTAAAPAGTDEGYYSASVGLPHEGYQAPQIGRTRSNTNPSGRGGGVGGGGTDGMQLSNLSGGNSPL
ncbi:putative Vacuolar-sorting receptor 7 [Nannochloris sp. 'desiccata']|nr:hypothetical protein KSW81_000855 [Chlorella desiccata (nom. nud.)]KAH7620468.1 putative Vacuolar-sorting receptor 7 [Chlorella desiccata (nom. nud.)]